MDERLKRIKELFSESEKRNGELSHENFELKKRIAELEKINIVHCKECEKWAEIKGTRYGYCDDYYFFRIKTEADHFCAYGERRV